ncbi:MAG: protein kinase [candidate division Zixibacteria bacterium]|nr:protein kinase [candidate division Zixibacteria bacterium]
MIGKQVHHYKILEKLGSGGMGDVYLAEDTRLKRKVALKFLPSAYAAKSELRKRFEREAQAVAALTHPNIVAVYELGEHEDQLFIAMEYVPGQTLEARFQSGPLSLEDVSDIAGQICEGMISAHESKIIHRDIKPSNILLDSQGRVRILDFGLARLSGATRLTRTGTTMGTLMYQSPEQARGEAVDHRTDIFSLGCVLYEMIAGVTPFQGDYDAAIVYAIAHEDPKPLSAIRSDVDDALQSLVHRMLAKEPSERPQSVSEVLADLNDPSGKSSFTEEPARLADTVAATDDKKLDLPGKKSGRDSDELVAILPFANVTGNSADDWLGTGISETILADLKKISGLSCIASDRVKRIAGDRQLAGLGDEALLNMGSQLFARWVVSGSYQRMGDSVRIIASVADTARNEVIESCKVDGMMSDIFTLQDQVVKELAGSMNRSTSALKDATTAAASSGRNQAFELFARGRQLFSEFSLSGADQAQEYFEKAIAAAPDYALAYSGLGSLLVTRFIHSNDPACLREGIQHLEKSIEIDDKLADPFIWLTYAYMRDRLPEKAIEYGEKAVQLDPTHPLSHYFLGAAYSAEISREYDIDAQRRVHDCYAKCISLEPRYQPARMLIGLMYVNHGMYDRALPHFEKSTEIERSQNSAYVKFVGGPTLLGGLYLRRGGESSQAESVLLQALESLSGKDHVYKRTFEALTLCYLGEMSLGSGSSDEALGQFDSALELIADHPQGLGLGFFFIRANLGMARAFHNLGMRREALSRLQSAEKSFSERKGMSFQPVFDGGVRQAHFDFALYYSKAGEIETATSHLLSAIEMGWRELPALSRYPEFEPLREESLVKEALQAIQSVQPW